MLSGRVLGPSVSLAREWGGGYGRDVLRLALRLLIFRFPRSVIIREIVQRAAEFGATVGESDVTIVAPSDTLVHARQAHRIADAMERFEATVPQHGRTLGLRLLLRPHNICVLAG